MGGDRIRCLGRRKAWSSEVVGDYARNGGSGEGAAVPEADGNRAACFGPTNPEVSRYCWCQDHNALEINTRAVVRGPRLALGLWNPL